MTLMYGNGNRPPANTRPHQPNPAHRTAAVPPWEDPKGVRREVADALYDSAGSSDDLRRVFTADDARYLARHAIAVLRGGAIRDTLRHCLAQHLMTPAAAGLLLTALGDPDGPGTAAVLTAEPGR